MSTPPLLDADRISAELEKLGNTWADENAAASVLEEVKASLLAKIAAERLEKGDAIGKAEIYAKADAAYEEHLRAMVEARRKAIRAKVRYDTYRTKAEMLRTNSATDRAMMQLK